MRKTVLFIAMSLDGYIAGKDGSVDWLQGQEPGQDDMTSYEEFAKGIDTVIMGSSTYEQIVHELSPGEWVYKDFTSYVLTHREFPQAENIRFTEGDVCNLVRNLMREEGKDIWICGGASIIQPLVREGLISRFHISIIPVILGDGIRLFERMDGKTELKLAGTKSYNGITDVVYEKKSPEMIE